MLPVSEILRKLLESGDRYSRMLATLVQHNDKASFERRELLPSEVTWSFLQAVASANSHDSARDFVLDVAEYFYVQFGTLDYELCSVLAELTNILRGTMCSAGTIRELVQEHLVSAKGLNRDHVESILVNPEDRLVNGILSIGEQRRRGGQSTAKKRREENAGRDREICEAARRLLADGKEPHEVARSVHRRYQELVPGRQRLSQSRIRKIIKPVLDPARQRKRTRFQGK